MPTQESFFSVYSVRTNEAYWDFYREIEIFILPNENFLKGKNRDINMLLGSKPWDYSLESGYVSLFKCV